MTGVRRLVESGMSVKIGRLLADLKAGLVRLYGPRLSGVFLFGSRARDEAEPRALRGTLPIFLSDVKARRGEPTADSLQLAASVRCGIRNTPERLAVNRELIASHGQ